MRGVLTSPVMACTRTSTNEAPENRPSFAFTAASATRARMSSQALATTLQTLAVEFDPPATGAGGRLESPTWTSTRSSGSPADPTP